MDEREKRSFSPEEHHGPPPPPCPQDMTPPMLVNEISRLFFACMRQYDREMTGVMAQHTARILMRYLVHHEGCGQLELAEVTRLSTPTVSIILSKMEQEGLVERRRDPNDRRAAQVYLTEKGHAHDEEIHHNLRYVDQVLMKNFNPEEYETAKTVLLRMRDNILKELAQPRASEDHSGVKNPEDGERNSER